MTMAVTCWNLALFPKRERPAMLKDLLNKAVKPGQPSFEVEQTMEAFVARKNALFPNDRRIILDYTFIGEGDSKELFVKFATDHPPSAPAPGG